MSSITRKSRLAGALMIAAAVLPFPASGAAARASTIDQAADPAADISDLQFIANERGITLEEATARVGWQDDFALLATEIEDAYPKSFAGAEITSELPAIGTIRFKGDVPPEIRDLSLTNDPDVKVVVEGGAPLASFEIDEAIIAAHHAIHDTGLVGDTVTTFDFKTERVHVEASPGPNLSDVPTDDVERMVLGSIPAEIRNSLDLVVDERVRTTDDARRGGGRLEEQGSTGLQCTSGFNVKAAVTSGVATAGHCPNSLTHENTNGDPEFTLNLVGQNTGDWGDFQWHTSSETEPAEFYRSPGVYDIVTARANPVLDETICRFGQTTGRECDTVADLSLCVTVDGVEACRLVRMDHDEASGGDSGGPWYDGSTAYGFHKGSTSCGFLWQNSCDVWSRVTYIDNALNVTVKTQ